MKTALIPRLLRLARRIARQARRIYIGRTGDPKRRLLQHSMRRRLPYLSVLHWAHGQDEADRIEMALIAELSITSLKIENGDEGGTGRFARQERHAIYLAWEPKSHQSIASVDGGFGYAEDPACDPSRVVPFHLTTTAWGSAS